MVVVMAWLVTPKTEFAADVVVVGDGQTGTARDRGANGVLSS